ncbi:MAG: DUF983 domain-containing protein [Gemmataceae bacterium]
MFRGQFAMNDPCPVCGLLFQREEGYFLGAMYFSYVLGAAVILPGFFLAQYLLPGWNGTRVALLVWVLYLPLVPMIFRYSRTMWVHAERWGRFTDSTAGAYEKHRLREIAAQREKESGRVLDE